MEILIWDEPLWRKTTWAICTVPTKSELILAPNPSISNSCAGTVIVSPTLNCFPSAGNPPGGAPNRVIFVPSDWI